MHSWDIVIKYTKGRPSVLRTMVGGTKKNWSRYNGVWKMPPKRLYLRISQCNVVTDHSWSITLRIQDTATWKWQLQMLNCASKALIIRCRCRLPTWWSKPKLFWFCRTMITGWSHCPDFLFPIIYSPISRQGLWCRNYNWVMYWMRFCKVSWCCKSITLIWCLEEKRN
jgi:hypothetical protein